MEAVKNMKEFREKANNKLRIVEASVNGILNTRDKMLFKPHVKEYTDKISKMISNTLHIVELDHTAMSLEAVFNSFCLIDIGANALLAFINGYEVFYRTKFLDLLVSKHRAYGSRPLKAWGVLGILIKIDSKNERIINLSTSNEHSVESIKDSLIDIIGYCILGLLLMSGELE